MYCRRVPVFVNMCSISKAYVVCVCALIARLFDFSFGPLVFFAHNL